MKMKFPPTNSLFATFSTFAVLLIFILVSDNYEKKLYDTRENKYASESIESSITSKQAYYEGYKAGSGDGKPDVREIAIAVIATVATVVMAVFTWLLWHLQRISGETTKKQLRAYLIADKAGAKTLIDDVNVLDQKVFHGKFIADPIYFVDVGNFGQTPAKNVMIRTATAIGPPPDPNGKSKLTINIEAGARQEGSILSRYPIPPGGNQQTTVKLPINAITETQINDLKSGNAVVYIVGECFYTDIFGDTWVSPFRFFHKKSPNGNFMEKSIHISDEGNEEKQLDGEYPQSLFS